MGAILKTKTYTTFAELAFVIVVIAAISTAVWFLVPSTAKTSETVLTSTDSLNTTLNSTLMDSLTQDSTHVQPTSTTVLVVDTPKVTKTKSKAATNTTTTVAKTKPASKKLNSRENLEITF